MPGHNIYGGGNRACRVMPIVDTEGGIASVEVSKGFCGSDLLSTEVWQDAYNDNKNPHFYVFGGGYGAYTSVGSTNVTVSVEEQQTEGATTDMQLAKSTALTIESDGKTTSVEVSGGTVGDALKAAGVQVSKNRIVYPAQNTKITEDITVKVLKAKPVELTVDGKTRLIVLAYGKVEDSLKMAGVELGSDDILNVKRDDKVENIKKIKIQRVVYKLTTETAEVPFEQVTEKSDKVDLETASISRWYMRPAFISKPDSTSRRESFPASWA